MIALGSDTFSEGKISYDLVDEMCRVWKNLRKQKSCTGSRTTRAYATTASVKQKQPDHPGPDPGAHRTEVHIISNPSEQRFISLSRPLPPKGGEFNQIIQKGTAIVDVGFGSAQISLFDKDSLVATQNLLSWQPACLRSQLSKIPASVDGHRLHIEEIVDNELITFRKNVLKRPPDHQSDRYR